MNMKYYFLAGCLAFTISAAPLELSSRASCATGVHMIVARGTTEAPGEGLTGQTADAIAAQIPGSDSVALVYPASTYPSYASSEGTGTTAMTTAIVEYVTSCPDSKIVLLGWSQACSSQPSLAV